MGSVCQCLRFARSRGASGRIHWSVGVFALLAVWLGGCRGGDVEFHRPPPPPAPAVTAFDDMPGANEIAKAPAGYKTTPEQAADWKAKIANKQPFNDLQVRADVHLLIGIKNSTRAPRSTQAAPASRACAWA